MIASELAKKLDLEILNMSSDDREVTGGYCGDLLSWVMSRTDSGDAWITVMGNINSIGVAVLADVSCIILSENAALDGNALVKAKENNVSVFRSALNAYRLAVEISKLI
ncbi:MAG: hypothetical protein K5756_06465 [Clostridiales bacterium]|nr:hypothetical protein [Clostridiales bacterium]